MEQYIEMYKAIQKKLKAYEYVIWLMSWDQETEAPDMSVDYRSKQFQVMAEEAYKLESDPKYVEAIEKLFENLDQLKDKEFQIEIIKAHKALRIVKKVPKDEWITYQVLTQSGSHIWAQAKEKNDFEMFAPTLEKIVEFNKKLVKYLETPELKGYDILLDIYEEGFGVEKYDEFFGKLREELVPFVLEVTTKNKERFNKKLTKAVFPTDKQKEFSNYLLEIFKYDTKKGLLKESENPFT